MKKMYLGILSLAVLFASPLQAQQAASEAPRAEIEGGFSYFRQPINNGLNMWGWQANPDINFTRNFALAMDFGGQYRSINVISGSVTESFYEYMAGPRFKYRTDRVTLFAHGLVGGNAAHIPSRTQGAFAVGFGGGMDVNLNNRVAIRVFQLDSIHNHSGGMWGHALRGSVGVVFKLGKV